MSAYNVLITESRIALLLIPSSLQESIQQSNHELIFHDALVGPCKCPQHVLDESCADGVQHFQHRVCVDKPSFFPFEKYEAGPEVVSNGHQTYPD
jgi:hypothetical protein